jgi:uncharacterized protein YegP (UPF0339 family)
VKYEVYKAHNDEWRWRLRADNHEILAIASEGYRRRIDAMRAIELVQASDNAEIEIEGDDKSDRTEKVDAG